MAFFCEMVYTRYRDVGDDTSTEIKKGFSYFYVFLKNMSKKS